MDTMAEMKKFTATVQSQNIHSISTRQSQHPILHPLDNTNNLQKHIVLKGRGKINCESVSASHQQYGWAWTEHPQKKEHFDLGAHTKIHFFGLKKKDHTHELRYRSN